MKTVISFCLALFLACCLLMNGLLKANRTIKAKEQEIKTQAETIKQKDTALKLYHQRSRTLQEQLDRLTAEAAGHNEQIQTAIQKNHDWASQAVPEDLAKSIK
ncbi:hypothetical protein ACTHT4_09910 [Neisseria sp. P0022.S007]|uniref:hypothetical protein n=1 Tax=unclassified Neisseria TaxID=2623750 RepID=UPI003F7F92EF